MDPNDNDWLGSCKSQPIVDLHNNGNVAKRWQWRELGLNPPSGAPNRTILENVAEDRLVHKVPLNLKCCDLPGYPRSTFLMVFSPDGTTVASTHGNHNIYLTELASGKHVRILRGHPRTPWCIAFHPSHAELVGSGCLGGQVRVWDLSGGSEVWTVASETVIASIAFHPRDQLLVVATYNELYFWDWSQPAPFTKVCTNNLNEKVRYVAFDALGHKLITGIAVWSSGGGASSLLQQAAQNGAPNNNNAAPPDPPPNPPGAGQAESSAQELIVTSYHNLVQRYDSLVRNYHRLFLARSQGPNTTDRGTDPMEMDWSNSSASRRQYRSTFLNENDAANVRMPRMFIADIFGANNSGQASTSTERSQEPTTETERTTSSEPPQDGHSVFGSRPSAFQPLNDNISYRTRSTPHRLLLNRVLPNPFSSSSLSRNDLRHRIREISVSRTRVFSRDSHDIDEPADGDNEAQLLYRPYSSSRTTAFPSTRYTGTPDDDMDVSDLTRRTLSLGRLLEMSTAPVREPEDLNSVVNENTRRRALERLLELEQIPSDQAGIGSDPVMRNNLEQMFLQTRDNSEETLDAVPTRLPVPGVGNNVPTGSRDDHSANNPPTIEPSRLDNPQITSQSIPILNFIPTPQDSTNIADRLLGSDVLNPLQTTSLQTASAQTGMGPTSVVSTDETVSPPPSGANSQSGQSPSSLSITQSLDIIRDILRDSGTRLLNLITDMSYSTLASVDVGSPRDRLGDSNRRTEGLHTVTSPRSEANRRRRTNNLSSASDTDSDHSLEVNIYRTRNATFPESNNTDTSATNTTSTAESERVPRPTNRMVVNLGLVDSAEGPSGQGSIRHTLNNNRINITVSSNRFRLRTNNLEDSNTQTPERQPEENNQTLAAPSGVSAIGTPVPSAPGNSSATPASGIAAGFSEAINGSSASDASLRRNSSTAAFFSSPAGSSTTASSPTSATSSTVADKTSNFSTAAGPSAASTSTAAADSAVAGPSTAFGSSERQTRQSSDWQMPSTSQDLNFLCNALFPLEQQPVQNRLSAAEALSKVKLGIEALQRHTSTLTDMWLRGTRTSMRELRIMWEDLRRQIVALNRNARSDNADYFTRSLIERCKMLTETSSRSHRRIAESLARTERTTGPTTETAVQANVPANTPSQSRSEDAMPSSNSIPPNGEQASTSCQSVENAPGAHARNNQASAWNRRLPPSGTRSAFKARCTAHIRRRLQSNFRWRSGEDVVRRRQRIVQRIEQYLLNARTPTRARQRESTRNAELNHTRHEVRVRSMQVLSIMFNVMTACLEEGELSSQIILMLRTLKKALGVTCLLMMTSNRRRDPVALQNFQRNRDAGRSATPPNVETPSSRQQYSTTNTDSVPVNTTTDDSNSTSTSAASCSNSSEPLRVDTSTDTAMPERFVSAIEKENKSTSTSTQSDDRELQDLNAAQAMDATDAEQPSTSYKWSNRLAVQISAANKNQSETARRRRDIYLERKRLKALHRHNPIAHPLTKRKITLPLVTHRMPTLRMVPSRDRASSSRHLLVAPSPSIEPVAGPSNPQPSTSANDTASSAPRTRQEYREYRAGLFRFAQFHAARLRNATRNRYRIRLYTPSSVREMFDILTTSSNERETETPPTLNNAQETQNRRSFSTYRPRLLTVRNNLENVNRDPESNRPLLNNVSVPLVQVNNLPVNEAPAPPNPPRVNEYLQPIILAQNALVVEEAVGGGLLEAGLISESLVMPVHRVQAWDFTWGEAPDITDSTKNVVVQRCKIHNDASIDISRDGQLLVALLPVHRMRNMSHRLGVYSLEWGRLGECLHTVVLEQSAVSVALSPTARHLAVGLGSRRVTTLPHNRNNVFALLFRLAHEKPVNENSRQCGLIPVRILDHNWEHGFTSLNCLRWAPAPGQGLLYANNTGQLIILS